MREASRRWKDRAWKMAEREGWRGQSAREMRRGWQGGRRMRPRLRQRAPMKSEREGETIFLRATDKEARMPIGSGINEEIEEKGNWWEEREGRWERVP